MCQSSYILNCNICQQILDFIKTCFENCQIFSFELDENGQRKDRKSTELLKQAKSKALQVAKEDHTDIQTDISYSRVAFVTEKL